jgi:hypothetical protein
MKQGFIITALVAALGWTPVQSAIISHEVNINQAATPWSVSELVLPQFDPLIGTLTSVELRYTGWIFGELGVENLEFKFDLVFGTLSGGFTVMQGETLLMELDVYREGQILLDSFDGDIDFAGTSGYTFNDLSTSGVQSVFYVQDGPGIDAFIGTGTMSFNSTAEDTSFVTAGAGNPAFFSSVQAQGKLEVFYNYHETVIPEPSNLVLLGGMLGILFHRTLRRYRRSRNAQLHLVEEDGAS